MFAVAPQISITTLPSKYIEGSAVSITCTASGIPDPDVKWFRNKTMKSEGTKTASLTFNDVTRTDDGRYKCQANNSAGETENCVELVVHCKLNKSIVFVYRGVYSYGQRYAYHCL